ncbi:MAG: S41 family peptidase [Gammaproteobacteria bacterium]|nr:S41 family peptidase [Gammaproteobacteria bacterium]
MNWTAAIPDGVDWARISSGSSGANSGTVGIEIDANPGAARQFELTVSGNATSSRTVAIRQAEAPAVLDLSASPTELDGNGGTVSVQVRNTGYATMEWAASLPDDVDWAYIESGDAGADSGEIVVRYSLNGGAGRELEVTVTAAAASNSPQSLALTQEWFGLSACTYPEARQEVYDILQDVYYFNDEPEQQARYDRLSLDDFNNIDALLDEIRWMPEIRDRDFTYWLTGQESEMLFSGEAYIFGFRMNVIVNQLEEPLYLEVLDVYEGSPAGDAGLERGDRITSLNGKAVGGLTIGQIQAELGPNEEGYEVEAEVETLSGASRAYSMAKRLVEIRTVPQERVAVFDTDAGKVGYLHFRTFFGDANERLLEEFAGFRSEGVRHVIVDLRYNGGGSVPIAHGLATLIGGPELFENQTRTVLSARIHNRLLESNGWNQTTYFGCDVYGSPGFAAKCENESVLRNLENVVFITGRGSASASELVISALQPHENVTLAGDRTYGKPVGQYGFEFCLTDPDDQFSGLAILWPVSFATVNSEGFEEYYDGIPVTQGCEAPDDLGHQLGDSQEDRIAAALRFIETGSCGADSSSRLARQDAKIQRSPAQDPVTQFFGH